MRNYDDDHSDEKEDSRMDADLANERTPEVHAHTEVHSPPRHNQERGGELLDDPATCGLCTELAELRQIYASAPIGLAMVDRDLRFVRINEHLAEINGWPAAMHVGRTVAEMIPALAARVQAILGEVIATGKPALNVELSGETPAQPGVTRHWRAGYHPVLGHGGIVLGVSAVVEEITAQKRAEDALRVQAERYASDLADRVRERTAQLEAANKALEAFSYSVSHDLRAPLRTIQGFSRILVDDYAAALDTEASEHLRRIVRAAENMNRIIDALLDLARLSRLELRRQPTDLTAMAQEIAAELQTTEPDRQATFRIDEGLHASADARLLRVAVTNLLANAWKYTGARGEACIEVGQLPRTPAAAAVSNDVTAPVFFVRDNGTGFDGAYSDRLFIAFSRLHSPEEFDGDGIGLAIVERIVSRHGGRIWAEGRVDQGATFYFTLEREQQNA